MKAVAALLMWVWFGAARAAESVPPGAAEILRSNASSASGPAATSRKRAARWSELSAQERDVVLAGVREQPLGQRLLEVSQRFLDTPYLPSPLGEGEGTTPDPDPLERYDAVDCLTFVEETVALSLSRSEDEVAPLLQSIRYVQRTAYEDRNHLMEAQWLPNNVQKGFLRDVTRRLGGADVVTARKQLTRDTWRTPSSRALALPPERQLTGEFSFPMIPIDRVLSRARQIPSGTLLLVVREEKLGKATRITHLGFVIQKPKRTYLRHAARGAFGRVVDEDLESFLIRNAKYGKWKVTGVALYEVLARDASTVANSQHP